MTFSIAILLKFFVYVIFWLQLPGMLLTDLLMSDRHGKAVHLLSGYFSGVMLMAALYYVESLIGLPLLDLAGPVLSILALVYFCKKGSFKDFGQGLRPTHVILFVGLYLMAIVAFQLKYIGSLSGSCSQVYHDFLFHTGNIASLSRSFPNTDIRVSSVTFYYHYFNELTFAMCKHIFKMEAFRLYMTTNPFTVAWPLTLALTAIGNRLSSGGQVSEKRYFFYCTGIFVSCLCLYFTNVKYATFPLSWLDNHLFTNANALGLAVSLHVLILEVLVEAWDEGLSKKNMALIFILALTTTCFKGTTAVLVVGIVWVVFLVQLLITRDFQKQRLVYAIEVAVAFIIGVALVVIGLQPSGSNNRTTELSLTGTISYTRVGQVLEKLGIDYSNPVIAIPAMILCAIVLVGPMIIPLVALMVRRFKTLIKEGQLGNIYDWFAIGSIIMSLGGFCLVEVTGFSQGYLVISCSPFIFYCIVSYMKEGSSQLIKKWTRAFWIVGCIFLALDLCYYVKADIDNNAIYSQDAEDRDDLVDADTMAGYIWLRDNSPEDAIIAVDRLTESLDYRKIYFYASAFSERQCYLEGYYYTDVTTEQAQAMEDINETFYSDDAKVAETAMDINNINYLVVTEHAHSGYEPSSTRLHLVFENDSIRIYKYE